MRSIANAGKVEEFMRALGAAARGPGRCYFTGGATAVLHGWRESTVDIDIKLEPEPVGVFEALAEIKDTLDVNVELAAPDAFIPALEGWRDHSVFITRHGSVDFFHYDFRAQALAKIERGHQRDLTDVAAMLDRGLVGRGELKVEFSKILGRLIRYPAIDSNAFRSKLEAFLGP
ncbi:MAG TPA: hypothetical protein VGJ84_23850 [Polyangiaceae bacterium]